MQKIIGTTDLQRNFRAVFDEVANQQIPYILTRGSRPEAALVPYAEYLRFQQLQEQDVLRRIDMMMTRLAEENAGFNDDEVMADVAAAIEEVRSGEE
jgi:prevent-host-death family protein